MRVSNRTFLHQLKLATYRLRYEAAAGLVLATASALERCYRPDQPRVPAGSSDGGQWTTVGPVSSESVGSDRQAAALGKTTFSGYLVGITRDPQTGRLYCLYFDSREKYTFSVRGETNDYCPAVRLHY